MSALTTRLLDRPDPCERIAYDSGAILLGEFRCPVTYSNFAQAGRVVNYVIAFPRSAVWIEHESAPRFVADPGRATLYNPFTPYLRAPIAADGDMTDWIALSEPVARDLVRQFNASDAESDTPFRFLRADVSPAAYVAQRALFDRVAGGLRDRLEIEERTIGICTELLGGAYASARGRQEEGKRVRALVEDAREIVMASLFENLGVADIAQRLEVSPFHLCHSFRAHSGTTLHAYRRDMRLRGALGAVAAHRGQLSSLAVSLGFYSHSHFTAAFRRAFGFAPTAIT